jgi:hypothetical protein
MRKDEMVEFAVGRLKKRDDYYELLKLTIIFLVGRLYASIAPKWNSFLLSWSYSSCMMDDENHLFNKNLTIL